MLSKFDYSSILFNVFINDIFYFVKQAVIYNYADDNTLSFIHNNLVVLKKVLEEESFILIDCFFFNNFMKATKSQAIRTLVSHSTQAPKTPYRFQNLKV